MRSSFLCLVLLVIGNLARGDVNPLPDVLRHPAQWQQRPLPGGWSVVSASPKILSSKENAPIYGAKPQRIVAYFEGAQLSQVVVVYMETGYNLNLWNKVDEAQRRNYLAAFAKLKADLPSRLEQDTGQKGNPVKLTAGADNFVFDVLEYRASDLTWRLYTEDQSCICLSICRTVDASGDLRHLGSPEERRSALAKNVEHKPNSDVVIKNLPVLDQDGRPYCGPATWTEIGRYYGLNVYQEMMLSGGREGGNGVKEAAQLTQSFEKNFDFAKVQQSIDSGNPIWFSAPGHVALISGYNKNLKTILRTDSWGEGSHNKPVPLAQFTKEANGFMYFEPSL